MKIMIEMASTDTSNQKKKKIKSNNKKCNNKLK